MQLPEIRCLLDSVENCTMSRSAVAKYLKSVLEGKFATAAVLGHILSVAWSLIYFRYSLENISCLCQCSV